MGIIKLNGIEYGGGDGDNSSALSELSDVNITSPTQGQVLQYNATNDKWVNGPGGGGSSDVTDVTVNGVSVVDPVTKIAEVEVPVKVSDLQNDSGFITSTVSNLTNYYQKSETYTQSEVDALISAIVTLNILVVQTLPTTDISRTTIYLVPKSTPDTQDVYDEYINLDGTSTGWEHIGSTQIDLSNYYTKSQVDTLLADKADVADLAEVATSGSYNDLSDKPTIPTQLSQLSTDSTHRVVTDTEKSTWNGKLSDNPTFTEASTRANIASGESFATILGKIKKFFTDLKTVAFTGSYNDLSNKPTIPAAQVNSDWNATSGVAQILNKPTIPTVNNATLTIQKNGTTVKTFTANASSNVTANITVPTKVSELTNDSNFVADKPSFTEASSRANIASGETFATILGKIKKFFTDLKAVAFSGSYNDLSDKPTIPTVNNATLTIQKNGTNVQTFTANQSTNATANITVPTKVSELTNDSGYTTNVGTITGIKMNGASKGTSGVVDLGTVITAHQDISGKVNKSGDTMTGNLVIQKTGTHDNNYPATLTLRAVDSTNSVNSNGTISAYDGGASGSNMVISPAGNMFIGSGEGPLNHYNLYQHSTGEVLYMTSDNQVHLQANGQTIANRIGLMIDNSGNVLPEKADTATNNSGSIGTSSYKWANGYFTNINGVAVGDSPKFTDNNNAVAQTATTTNANYEVLFSVTADNTTRTEGARKNSNLKFNPSTGNLQATQLNGVAIGSSPKFTDTDTKNTAGSTDTSSKIFLIGATSQAANPQTYSQDTAYVGTDGCLYSGGTKVLTAHQDISDKYDKITQTGIKQQGGNGQYGYFKIATLKVTNNYVNGPIAFELSQRQYEVTMIQVSFVSANNTDPALSYFITNQRNNYWIVKETTSTWSIYGQYSEKYGACSLHRIVGFRVNNGVTVTVNMENVSEVPSGATQVTYGGNCAYATSAGNADKVNNLTVQTAVPANAKFTDTTYSAGSNITLSGTTFSLTKANVTGALGYTPPTSDTNTHRPIQVNGTEILGNNTTALNLKAGSNVSVTNSSGTVTIAATNNAVTQTATTTNADYEVLFSATADNTTRTEGARKTSEFRFNPSTNTLGTGNFVCNGGSVTLYTPSSSSNDSGDILFLYGNKSEKARIWVDDTFNSTTVRYGPNYRAYSSDGKSSMQSRLALADNVLALTGGTMTGAINFHNTGSLITSTGAASSATTFLKGSAFLNLCSPGIQCRNFADNAWTGIAGTAFTPQNNSSRKIKENIKPITEEEAQKLLEVNVVSFDYKQGAGFGDGDERKGKFGVIAEEINEIIPSVVSYQINDDHTIDYNIPSGVSYDKFVPHLIKMVQMQQKEIDDLKAQLKELQIGE